MKVLLIQPPWSQIYGRFKKAAKLGCISAPLGLCYLGAILKTHNHTPILLDAESENLTLQEIINRSKDISPDIIGITMTTPLYRTVFELAELLKKHINTPIIVGGVHPTIFQEKILEESKHIDFVVIGEGEETLTELIHALDNKTPLQKIKGLVFREQQKITKTPPRPYNEDLDKIPFPDRTLLDLEKYKHSLPGKGIIPYADLFTGRGCPFQCAFCSQHTMYGRKVRYRSIQNVIEEIEIIVKDLKISHIILMDETLTLNRNRILAFCEEIKKRNLQFTWEGWTHASTVDEHLLKKMKEAGMIKISFGIESGNQNILNFIKKAATLDQIRNAYRYAKKAKIETRGSVIIGHPHETKKTIKETINFVCSIKECDQIFMGIATPYPGTDLWKYANEGTGGLKLLSKNFEDYQRYGDPVIEVNDVSKKDLIFYQKWGLIKFYSRPSRFIYNFKRAGIKAGIKNLFAFISSLLSRNTDEKK